MNFVVIQFSLKMLLKFVFNIAPQILFQRIFPKNCVVCFTKELIKSWNISQSAIWDGLNIFLIRLSHVFGYNGLNPCLIKVRQLYMMFIYQKLCEVIGRKIRHQISEKIISFANNRPLFTFVFLQINLQIS